MTPEHTAPPPPRLDELVGVRDACREYDLMPWTIRNAQRRGELTPYKLPGNRVAYRRAEVREWAARRHGNTSNRAPSGEGTP